MQTPKARSGLSEGPQKVSPRPIRQLKTTGTDFNSVSSSTQACRTPKERSPKVVERRSPRSPASEKKRPSRISELESQVFQLQEDLKKAKDDLSLSESCKQQALEDAEESKKELLAMSSKLEQSQQQHEETHVIELHKIPQECELKTIQKQKSVDAAALASAMDEIQMLNVQLGMVSKSEDTQTKCADTANTELQCLKENLAETLSLLKNMKIQLRDCKESEARAQELVSETRLQMETAKETVEALTSDGLKAVEAYNSIASELDQSRAHVNLLEALVNKIEVDPINVGVCETKKLEAEIYSLNCEVGRLRSALESAELKYHEEQVLSIVQISSSYEQLEQTKSESRLRETELWAEVKKTKTEIEELKANLMDKETELQGISEENEELHSKLEKNMSRQQEYELAKEVKKLKDLIADMKVNLMFKDTELQKLSEENEMLNTEIKKREAVTEVEVKRVARVVEQLEAEQVANCEMEAELRKLKVQSDQWRKAAEVAAAMIAADNDSKFMERTGSFDNNYINGTPKMNSPYSEDTDDDFLKKKNGNVLKKIGVLWKKPQK